MRTISCCLLLSSLVACASSSGDLDDSKSGTTAGTTEDPGGDEGTGGSGGGDSDGGDDGTTAGTDYDLYINEFMASNASTLADEGGAFPDWIELYNGGDTDINLGGWTITDDLEEPEKHPLDSALVVEAGGYLVLFADDDEDEGTQHVGFNLSASGESIGLYSPDGRAVDELDYGELGTDVSIARVPDGSASWEVTDSPTPGASNGD
jgi:hypothetical protein